MAVHTKFVAFQVLPVSLFTFMKDMTTTAAVLHKSRDVLADLFPKRQCGGVEMSSLFYLTRNESRVYVLWF